MRILPLAISLSIAIYACATSEPPARTAASSPAGAEASPSPSPSPSSSSESPFLDGDELEMKALGTGGHALGSGSVVASAAPAESSSKTAVQISAANPSSIEPLLASNRWRFKLCHIKAIAAVPTAAGDISIKLIIDNEGNVTSSTATKSTAPTSLTECVVAVPRAFKALPGNAGTYTFTVSLTLT